MKKSEPLALQAVIPSTASAIKFAGGRGEEGLLQLSFLATGEVLERLLNLRGKQLKVVFVEDDYSQASRLY
jgi:hypothetical protein